MPWGAIAIAAASSLAASKVAQREYELARDDMAPFLGRPELPQPEIQATPVHKCESCGSRQFAKLNGVRICAYCRSEA